MAGSHPVPYPRGVPQGLVHPQNHQGLFLGCWVPPPGWGMLSERAGQLAEASAVTGAFCAVQRVLGPLLCSSRKARHLRTFK